MLSIESLQPFLRSAKSSFVKLTSGDQKAKLTIIFTYAATCRATKSMSTKSSSFSELDSSSSAKVSRIPGEGIKQSFSKNTDFIHPVFWALDQAMLLLQ